MTKDEAVKQFVDRDFSGIPLDWVEIVAQNKGEEIFPLPMWGTMWIVDNHIGERLMNNSRVMLYSTEDLLDSELELPEHVRAEAVKCSENKEVDFSILEEYIDEEMSGARCVMDKNGRTTAVYIYKIDGQYVIGVNGAGWDFYHGVWDMLYDLLGLQWHTEESNPKN